MINLVDRVHLQYRIECIPQSKRGRTGTLISTQMMLSTWHRTLSINDHGILYSLGESESVTKRKVNDTLRIFVLSEACRSKTPGQLCCCLVPNVFKYSTLEFDTPIQQYNGAGSVSGGEYTSE